MDIVKIKARVTNDVHSAFWHKATLHGCRFETIIKTERDRVITGQAQVTQNTLLTFRIASGDMDFVIEEFWIICIDSKQPEQLLGDINNGYIQGNFEILAYGSGEPKASLLRTWWFEWAPTNGGQTRQTAIWLMQQLKKKKPSPAPHTQSLSEIDNAINFNSVEAWTFAPI
ncbi:MAG: hypothetical protein OT477_16200 [Chloroflexi bacterium]|nr:hypothetical protein [Chloroflexota bacterium]